MDIWRQFFTRGLPSLNVLYLNNTNLREMYSYISLGCVFIYLSTLFHRKYFLFWALLRFSVPELPFSVTYIISRVFFLSSFLPVSYIISSLRKLFLFLFFSPFHLCGNNGWDSRSTGYTSNKRFWSIIHVPVKHKHKLLPVIIFA